MSDNEYPIDNKEQINVLPIHPINEDDVELVVGQPTRRCFWGRLRANHCRNACAERKPRSPLRRAIRIFLTVFVVLGLVGFFTARHHIRGHWKRHPIHCVPVTDTTTTLELPLAHKFTHIGLTPSLSAGDAKIVHSEDVKEGTVVISFDLPKDTPLIDEKDDPKLFTCYIAGPKFVSVGVHAKHGHEKRKEVHRRDEKEDHPHHKPIHAVSTTITLPASEVGHARGVSFHGPGFFHRKFGKFARGCYKKRLRMAINKAVNAARAEKWVIKDAEEAN